MTYRIIDHDSDQHVVGQNEQGERLNFNVGHVLNPVPVVPVVPAHHTGTGMRAGGTAYVFDKDGILAAHSHDAATLHNIEVTEGRLLVRRSISGDIEAKTGDVVSLVAGEVHSVEALTFCRTVHWQLASLEQKSGDT